MAPRPDETLLSEVNPFLVISPSNTKIREVEEVKVKDEKEQILDAIGSKVLNFVLILISFIFPLSLGQMAPAEVPGCPYNHLATNILPPSQYGLLQS